MQCSELVIYWSQDTVKNLFFPFNNSESEE